MAATDLSFRYTWLMWAAAFMIPWLLVFMLQPALRRPMVWASVLTASFGLTKQLFVPGAQAAQGTENYCWLAFRSTSTSRQ